jgi:thioesterase domain-containing protein
MKKVMLDPTMGWGELAIGGVKIIDAPGSHQTMVAKPHVEPLALLIRDYLNGTETS